MEQRQSAVHSLIELLETIADNKYVLGDRLVEVGVSGPNLEATLASIAMAQGELGHARLLYNWCFDLRGLKGKKPEIYRQTGKALASAVNVHNWITLIAALYATNTAIDAVLQSALDANHPAIVSRIQKLIREQQDHLVYAKHWAQQLAHERGAVPHRFRAALNAAANEAAAWLKEVESKEELQQEGYLPNGVKLVERLQQELKTVAAEPFVQLK
ncbi:phenylacetic acid catabolic family protein [Geobacillus kaustophilus]|uniref:Phenylacetic acid catabolic family protein n=1 Tax=Geobacillus kaustophilus TaxID=1462 RepID=A0A0D8BQJ9_GEOKU|nr:Phenylacetic acid catabolic protein [Geobacillus kaustophilus]KJE26254.1 phenylacetic acid catabolic family protein [Geobacillus kaustophilus]